MLPRHPFMRLLAINALSGAALAGLIVTTLVVFDVGRLGTLLAGDHNPAVALAILFGSFVVTCASVMMGSAVMMLARGHADRKRWRQRTTRACAGSGQGPPRDASLQFLKSVIIPPKDRVSRCVQTG